MGGDNSPERRQSIVGKIPLRGIKENAPEIKVGNTHWNIRKERKRCGKRHRLSGLDQMKEESGRTI